jgi:hypothetical protein
MNPMNPKGKAVDSEGKAVGSEGKAKGSEGKAKGSEGKAKGSEGKAALRGSPYVRLQARKFRDNGGSWWP